MNAMEYAKGALVLLGMIAVAALYMLYILLKIRFSSRKLATEEGITGDPLSDVAPKKRIGLSGKRLLTAHNVYSKHGAPLFKTLRVDVKQLDESKWRLKIRFVVVNTFGYEMMIDDIHVRIYERKVPTPAPLAIGYHGAVMLTQDNCILKDNRNWSLPPGDGYEIDLFFEISRLVWGGQYYQVLGPCRTTFGLLLDYYLVTDSGIGRNVLASDQIYVFQSEKISEWSQLLEVSKQDAEECKKKLNESRAYIWNFLGIDDNVICDLNAKHKDNQINLNTLRIMKQMLSSHYIQKPILK